MTELFLESLADPYEQLSLALTNLEYSEEPLLIRSGLNLMDLAGWHNYLKNHGAFQEDRRHFDSDSHVKLADWWEISYQPERASSYAYSKTRQPLHSDNAWFSDPAEINLFLMAKQAKSGGNQTIYTLTRLLEDLASDEPGLLDELLNTQVVIRKGEGFGKNVTTILVSKGNTPRCYWNYYRTDKSDPSINKMCNRFFRFLEKQESTTSVTRLHCATGDCMAFNDSLILHGRDAFEAYHPYDRIMYQSMWKMVPV